MSDEALPEPLSMFVQYALDSGVALAVLDQEIPRIRQELYELGVDLNTQEEVRAALNLTRALTRHHFNHVDQTCDLEDEHPVKNHIYMHLQQAFGIFGLVLRDRCQSVGIDFDA